MRLRFRLFNRALQILGLIGLVTQTASASIPTVVVSIPEQKLFLFDETGSEVASYKVSTSSYGLGDKRGTYNTPLGKLVIAKKIGANAEMGAVFKGGRKTGEICEVNARGRDPIVTRILHLRGLEKQNAGAFDRRIYIHGTPDERHIGKPVSYGCVRMRSRDVVELFDSVSIGTIVEIVDARVSKGIFAKTTWPTESAKGADALVDEKRAAKEDPSKNKDSKIAFASNPGTPRKPRVAPPTSSNAKDQNDSVGESMTLLEMPGMSFKFGPASSREVR